MSKSQVPLLSSTPSPDPFKPITSVLRAHESAGELHSECAELHRAKAGEIRQALDSLKLLTCACAPTGEPVFIMDAFYHQVAECRQAVEHYPTQEWRHSARDAEGSWMCIHECQCHDAAEKLSSQIGELLA